MKLIRDVILTPLCFESVSSCGCWEGVFSYMLLDAKNTEVKGWFFPRIHTRDSHWVQQRPAKGKCWETGHCDVRSFVNPMGSRCVRDWYEYSQCAVSISVDASTLMTDCANLFSLFLNWELLIIWKQYKKKVFLNTSVLYEKDTYSFFSSQEMGRCLQLMRKELFCD